MSTGDDVQRGKITFTPTFSDRRVAEGLHDLRDGRTRGPYCSAKEAIEALELRKKVWSRDRVTPLPK